MQESVKCFQLMSILETLQNDELNKVPKKILDFLKNNSDLTCRFRFNPAFNLEEQNIEKDVIASFIFLTRYWEDVGNTLENLNLNLANTKSSEFLNKIVRYSDEQKVPDNKIKDDVEKIESFNKSNILNFQMQNNLSDESFNIFSEKNSQKKSEIVKTKKEDEFSLVVYKQSFFKRLINKLICLIKFKQTKTEKLF